MTDYYETKSQPITKLMVWQAYKKVKSNKGSAGIDQMSWEELDKDLSSHLYKLWNRMTSGSYFPVPVKQVNIPKKEEIWVLHSVTPRVCIDSVEGIFSM